MISPVRATLAADGFEVADAGLSADEIGVLREAVSPILAQHQERGGVRNVATLLPSMIPVI